MILLPLVSLHCMQFLILLISLSLFLFPHILMVIHLTFSLLVPLPTSSLMSITLPGISDHYAIHSAFSVPTRSRSPRITKLIRKIKSINTDLFSQDIRSSSLFSAPAISLNSYVSQFSSILSSLLDKHAPLQTVACPSRARKPFITEEIIKGKAKRSRLQTIKRNTNHLQNI